MSNKKKIKGTKLSKFLKAPLRFLIRARDFYIQSLTECTTGHISYSSVMGCPTGQISIPPRSFSVGSSRSSNYDEDYRELLRAASTKKPGLDLLKAQKISGNNNPMQSRGPTTTIGGKSSLMVMPRSFSTGIGRIDEDKPCEFGDDVKVNLDVLPRSRSYAVSRRTGFV